MRRVTVLAAVISGVALVLAIPQVFAAEVAANLSNGEKIFKEGKGSVPACTSCHGEDGMGNDMMGTPRLAGQISQFLVKQLEDFATDKRMDTTMFIMNANAKGLSPEDRRDVAAYLHLLSKEELVGGGSNIKELVASGIQVGESHLGMSLVNYGALERGISGCRSCHDYNGRGVDPIYPKIGQQKFVYLVNQLKKWRDGSRANDPLGQMRKVAQNLTDEDILNVATFLTNASPLTIGNTRVPEQHPFMSFDTK
ncbi:MAG: c-type cytochrome [Gammaproteobacteria bacterium]|nr:c-type cytochrome [Gammaproteobacteria bacterium]